MLLDEIATKLISAAVGVAGSTASWSVKKNFVSPSPDRIIVVTETGGFPNQGHASALIDKPTFQLRVRGPKGGSSTARTKIGDARTALEGVNAVTLTGRYYVMIQAHAEPTFLGFDANQRPEYVMNFTALRSRT